MDNVGHAENLHLYGRGAAKQSGMKALSIRAALFCTCASFTFPSHAQTVGTSVPAASPQNANAPASATAGAEPSAQNSSDAVNSLDILVTARRVEENMQRVPVAVTALTSDDLVSSDIRDFHDALRFVPSLQTGISIEGNVNIMNFARVRGVSGIGQYFADAPSNKFAFANPFFDASSVQVLKGPQGTLFGEASNAGAQIVIPNQPGETLGDYVRATAGTLRRKSLEGAIDLPLVDGRVLLRLAGVSHYRDGYVKDIASGFRLGKQDYTIFRPSLILRPTDTLENYTIFEMGRSKYWGQSVGVVSAFNFSPPSQKPIIATHAALNGMTLAEFDAVRDQILARQIQLGPYKFDGWSVGCRATETSAATRSKVPGAAGASVVPQPCPPDGSAMHSYQIVNRTTWDITESLQLKNIFSYTWGSERSSTFEGDFTRLILRENNPEGAIWRKSPTLWSNELQLSGELTPGMDFVAGVFTRKNRSKANFDRPDYSAFQTSLVTAKSTTDLSERNWSAYGHVNASLDGLLDGLSASGGLRYSRDKIERTTYGLNATTNAITTVIGGPGTPNGEAVFKAVSYDLSLQYQLSPDVMIYVSNAKGYSSGGLQNITGIERFEPESLNNFELGLKSTARIGDVRLRSNLAAYYGRLNNAKVLSNTLATNPATGIVQFVAGTQNAATVEIKGFELELAAVSPAFEFTGFVSYSDPKYLKYASVDTNTLLPIDLSDTAIPSTPKWKAGAEVTYRLPINNDDLGDFSMTAGITLASQYWVQAPKPRTPTDPNNPNTGAVCKLDRTAANGFGPLSADGGTSWILCLPAAKTLDIGFDWKNIFGHENLNLGLRVDNVTKWSGPVGHGPYWDSLDFEVNMPAVPRTFYASVSYRF